MDLPEIEVVETPSEVDGGGDLEGQIKALDTEISTLEDRYDESDKPRIEALKREKAKLEEQLRSSQ